MRRTPLAYRCKIQTLVYCLLCGRPTIVNAAAFLIADDGLIVPPGRSDHCKDCLRPRAPGTFLSYTQPKKVRTGANGRKQNQPQEVVPIVN